MSRRTPSFTSLAPASAVASRVARSSSRKEGTRCELVLRRALRRQGLRYRLQAKGLPGRPDIVFPGAHVVLFCDGDFWHGRELEARLAKLEAGHNAPYWVAKITANVTRDRRHDDTLRENGWLVLRFWETDIHRAADEIATRIAAIVRERNAPRAAART